MHMVFCHGTCCLLFSGVKSQQQKIQHNWASKNNGRQFKKLVRVGKLKMQVSNAWKLVICKFDPGNQLTRRFNTEHDECLQNITGQDQMDILNLSGNRAEFPMNSKKIAMAQVDTW